MSLAATGAGAKPILFGTLPKVLAQQLKLARAERAHATGSHAIQLPAPPCPENGLLPPPLFGNCGLGELPATGLPLLGNMSYWGGHVQVDPKVYLVFWDWGEPGAFPASKPCVAENIVEGSIQATLQCDPDGAGKQMADFVRQLGGTPWAGVQTQYYETDASGTKQFITNPPDQLGGIWVDDANDASGLPKTTGTNPAGPTNTYTDFAQEAARAVSHFGITDLANADIVIAQPQNFSDPNAQAQGYCAFHDYVEPGFSKGIYDGITPGISYTNMPYVLNQGSGCGANLVNSGPAGKLDGFTMALGHEIEETVTDPGAEDIQGSLLSTKALGAWYDPFDSDENGDKCAYVGAVSGVIGGAPGLPSVLPIPGALHDMTGNGGGTFAVQSLWSNDALGGLGYCAG
jgi:serine protease